MKKFKATCKACDTVTIIACPNCSQKKLTSVISETGFSSIQCGNCFHPFSQIKCTCEAIIYLKFIEEIKEEKPPPPTSLEKVLYVWGGFFAALGVAYLFYKAFLIG